MDTHEAFTRNESLLIQDMTNSKNLLKETGDKKNTNILETSNKNSNFKLKLLEEENDDSSNDENSSSLDNDEEIDKTKFRSNNIQQLFIKLVDFKNAFKPFSLDA